MRSHKTTPRQISGRIPVRVWQLPILNSQFATRSRRRGTALIFVLGVLTLLALLGLVLIARTHGEFQRVSNQSVSRSYQAALDGVVRTIQETLRRDIWGNDPNPQLPFQVPAVPGGVAEVNEPWDAPGIDDRWLASLAPFDAGTAPAPWAVNVFPPATGNNSLPDETNVLTWPGVSYPGTDMIAAIHLKAGDQPYAWPYNSRENPAPPTQPAPTAASCRFYSATSLQNVPVLQTPPPFSPPTARTSLIPGSTTKVTIAEARRTWNSLLDPTNSASAPYIAALSSATGAGPGSPKAPLFPYFDTNADGIVDLYDADGDGIPDSPLSFVIPVDTGDSNAPKNLYAAVRIVDHNAMLNVNVASSLRKAEATPNPSEMSFSETRGTLQRRGQRTSELLLDDVVNPADRDYNVAGDRSRGLAWARSSANPDPDTFDRSTIKSKLVGGTDQSAQLFGLRDEASLRHRGLLVPYDRRFDSGADYTNIDRALANTLLWSRDPSGTYGARWSRLNADYQPSTTPTPIYEGYTDRFNAPGWRFRMSEDDPEAIRRQFFTTTSYDAIPGPDIVRRPLNVGETADQAINAALQQLWNLGMDWPVLIASNDPIIASAPAWWQNNAFSQKFLIPAAKMPPPAFRVQQIDLNMGDANTAAVREAFVRYAAAAMYLSLQGISNYQGIKLTDDSATPLNEALNRQYLAWQFAVNLADYRDLDDEPTVVEWPVGTGHYVFGVERQPFFTEAYAFLKAGSGPPPWPVSGHGDKWFFAVELFVPPYWTIDTSSLALRVRPGTQPDYPLSDFVHRTTGSPPGVLNGGPTGQYVVFCSIDINAPLGFKTVGQATYPYYQQFYQFMPALHPGITDFQVPTDGTGRVELVYATPQIPAHVIDSIDPNHSGGPLANDPGYSATGRGVWAKAPHCADCTIPNQAPTCFCLDDEWEFGLFRTTNGWRFTTGWQLYRSGPGGTLTASTRPRIQQSLGRPNEPYLPGSSSNHTHVLDDNIPESIWPGRGIVGPVVGNGFEPVPFSAFDTAGDLSKMLVLGSLTQATTSPPIIPQMYAQSAGAVDDVPATVLLASIAQYGIGSTTQSLPFYTPDTKGLQLQSKDRLAIGHVDFSPSKDINNRFVDYGMKWLTQYSTTQSPLFDGVDNDGNGLIDMADPLEGYAVLNRVAGRLNVNTAPASVLRSVPYMSLLPTSAEYLFHIVTAEAQNAMPANYDAAATFNVGAPRPFWDFATAIVATRENRPANIPPVTLRLPDSASNPIVVAKAAVAAGPPPPLPGSGTFQTLRGPIQNFADLARLNDRRDLLGADDDLFNLDRFTRDTTRICVVNHRYQSGDPMLGIDTTSATTYVPMAGVLSPDFRYRRGTNFDVVDYCPTVPINSPVIESGGVRARDVIFARWANVLTTRSDVFTAYIALIDEDGHYVQRTQVTLDRTPCFRERPAPINVTGQPIQPREMILPELLYRVDSGYTDDTK